MERGGRGDRAVAGEGGGVKQRLTVRRADRATSIDTNDRGRETAGAQCSVSVWCCQQL